MLIQVDQRVRRVIARAVAAAESRSTSRFMKVISQQYSDAEGLDYWQITVLVAARLGCNLDYDKLQDLAEQHRALRQIKRRRQRSASVRQPVLDQDQRLHRTSNMQLLAQDG